MAIVPTLNIVIPQGATYTDTFSFVNAVYLSRNLEPSTTAPPTTIYTLPLGAAVGSGTTLTFDLGGGTSIDLVTTATASLAARTISINPYTGTKRIPYNSRALTTARDLSTLTWRGSIRAQYSDTSPIATYAFNTAAASSGIIEGTIDNTQTTALSANAVFSDIPEDYQTAENFDATIFKAAYYWDWESVTGTGKVTRELQGRCWVTYEATK